MSWLGEDVRRGALLDDYPIFHDRDLLAHVRRNPQVVRNEQHRQVESGAQLVEQIQHLLDVSTLPNITIQVMPFKFGMHAAEGGAFTILRFPESDLPDVVYVEQLWGALYLDKREDVDPYLTAMEQLCVESTTPGGTAEILGQILREI